MRVETNVDGLVHEVMFPLFSKHQSYGTTRCGRLYHERQGMPLVVQLNNELATRVLDEREPTTCLACVIALE